MNSLHMPNKTFNHAFYLGFSVNSSDEAYPTEQEILHALLERVTSIIYPTGGNLLDELKQELDGPHDTYQND